MPLDIWMDMRMSPVCVDRGTAASHANRKRKHLVISTVEVGAGERKVKTQIYGDLLPLFIL